MFCPECGKEVSDQKKLCIYCGASITSQQPSSAEPSAAAESAKRSKKSKKSLWITIAIIAIAAVIGVVIGNMMGESMAEDLKNDSGSTLSTQSTTTATVDISASGVENNTSGSSASSATSYSSIFSERNIVRMDTIFFGLESAAFAKVNSDGIIDCIEYGYKDDIIHSYVGTAYIDVSAYTDEEKDSLDSQMRAYFADYESLSYFSISYHMGSNYYTITSRIDDLNDPDILHDAVAQGVLQIEQEGDYMSFSETEQNMLEQGYLKK